MEQDKSNAECIEVNDVTSILTFLFTLRPSIPPTAIAVVQGRQDISRIKDVCDLCNVHPEVTTLYVEGHGPEYPDEFHLTMDSLIQHGLKSRDNLSVLFQGKTSNAKTQADWLAQEIQKIDSRNIPGLYLVCPPYHLPRAFLTTLASLISMGLQEKVRMFPYPTPTNPLDIIDQDKASPIELWPGEMRRIIDYQAKGDVATWAQFKKYLEFMYSNQV